MAAVAPASTLYTQCAARAGARATHPLGSLRGVKHGKPLFRSLLRHSRGNDWGKQMVAANAIMPTTHPANRVEKSCCPGEGLTAQWNFPLDRCLLLQRSKPTTVPSFSFRIERKR